MWEIYDRLIAEIPEELTVRDCLVGLHWTLVRSLACGLALTSGGTNCQHCGSMAGRIAGMSVRRLAEQVKSWNFFDATLGMAAVNSVFNTPERLEMITGRSVNDQQEGDSFRFFGKLMRGKKVAVIGHFPGLSRYAGACELSILERNPQPGDLPDTACEAVLPQQDLVFITGVAMINKTLPRLLELSKQAYVALVGPSTPLAPFLFDYGVDVLSGTVVVDDAVRRVVAEGGTRQIFDHGALRFNIKRK